MYVFSLYFQFHIYPYLELSSGNLEASSSVNSCSQKLFQTILSDSQVHPHLEPLIYTQCHSLYDTSRHLPALYHTYNTPQKPLVLTKELVLHHHVPAAAELCCEVRTVMHRQWGVSKVASEDAWGGLHQGCL